MTSDRDPLRFLHFVRRSGDLVFARRLAHILDAELRALPRVARPASDGATGVLASLVQRLELGAA